MVKAKECCCGCTLRTGSLILLWAFMIINCLLFLISLSELIYGRSYGGFYKWRAFYFVLECSAGIICTTLGVYAIQKNLPNYLTFAYYCFCYEVIYYILSAIILVISPTWYYNIFSFGRGTYMGSSGSDYTIVIFVLYLFVIALISYFALIVRSCRDTMLKSNAVRGGSELPDPAAVGYNAA